MILDAIGIFLLYAGVALIAWAIVERRCRNKIEDRIERIMANIDENGGAA